MQYCHAGPGGKRWAPPRRLKTSYLRRQCEVATVQGRELAALAQKVTADTLEPIKHGLAEAFPDAR